MDEENEENNATVSPEVNVPGTKRGRKGLNTKKSQRECFVNFAIKNPIVWDSLASGYDGSWEKLTGMLNDLGPPQRAKDDWIKNFRDWIYQLKHKERSGSKSDRNKTLTNLEQKALAAFGNVSYEGDSSIMKRGIPSTSRQSQSTLSSLGSLPPSSNELPDNLIEELPDPEATADDAPTDGEVQGSVERRRPQKRQTLDVLTESLGELIEMKKQRQAEKKERDERMVKAWEELGKAASSLANSKNKE